MKKLTLLITLIATMFVASPAFAKSNAKRTKTTVVKTTKRGHTKTTTVRKNGKVVRSTRVVTRPTAKRTKTVKVVHRRPAYRHRFVKGDRVSHLPSRAVRVYRHGRLHFRVGNILFRPFFKKGHKRYLVVSV